MDSLINQINNFNFEENLDNQLDNLIDSFQSSSIDSFDSFNSSSIDYDQEWEELSINYSRLIYIDTFINIHNPTSSKFFNFVDRFLCIVDNKTQYYLKEIDWYNNPEFDGEFHSEVMDIKENLENSLTADSTYKKIGFLMDAFSVLVPIIEEFRKERLVIEVDEDFKRQLKKRKLN